MTASAAPERSASFIWAFIDRPPKARSAPSPARRSRSHSFVAAVPPATSTTNTSTAAGGGPKAPSASQASSTRSTPSAKPIPPAGGPPRSSTSPS